MSTADRRTKRVTIRHVAARAGVSTSSVSLVLRAAPGVSADTRKRVAAAMAALDYHPLAAARGMRGKTFTIGVLVSDLRNPFFGILIDGVIAAVSDTGYEPLVGPGGTSASSQARMVQAMRDRQMDGLILMAPHLPEDELTEIGKSVPLVVVGRHGAPTDLYDTVSGDDELGSKLIVDHLVGQGHRRISYIAHRSTGADDHRRAEMKREQGYTNAMLTHGLGDFVDVIPAEWSHAGGRHAAEVLLSRNRLPTAVHSGADVSALGLLDGLGARSSTTERIAVVGYDNTATAALPSISLSSVDNSGMALGSEAATLLLERIEGRTRAVHVMREPSLIVRSTSDWRLKDRDDVAWPDCSS